MSRVIDLPYGRKVRVTDTGRAWVPTTERPPWGGLKVEGLEQGDWTLVDHMPDEAAVEAYIKKAREASAASPPPPSVADLPHGRRVRVTREAGAYEPGGPGRPAAGGLKVEAWEPALGGWDVVDHMPDEAAVESYVEGLRSAPPPGSPPAEAPPARPTLGDVASWVDPRYGAAGAEVWYAKPSFARDGLMGAEWLAERGLTPRPESLAETHVLVGTVGEADLGNVYEMMQGERWSPRGGARELIAGLGLAHTSMSVGDAIRTGGRLWLVDRDGFAELRGRETGRELRERLVRGFRPDRGAKGLAAVAEALGYRDARGGQLQNADGTFMSSLLDFLDDNPGACDALFNWIVDEGSTRDGEPLNAEADES